MENDDLINEALEKAKSLFGINPIAAETILRQVLRVVPEHQQALQILGLVKYQTSQFAETLEIFQRLLELAPDNPDNYNNLGLGYSGLGYFEKAHASVSKAIEMSPNSPMFWNNLAIQYRHLKDLPAALEAMMKAIQLDSSAPMWVNLGGIYGHMKKFPESVECFKKAIELDPRSAAAHVDLAYSNHLMGNWKEAFEEYEWRFFLFAQLRYYLETYDQTKKWDGQQSLDGKRIILFAEQGLGDLIQFIRYAKDVKQRGAHVIIHCTDHLKSLIERCEGVDETFVRDIMIGRGESIPPHDFHCSLISLPYLLRCETYSGVPYIKPIEKLGVKSLYPDSFNIGIVWAGNPGHPHDATRSVQLQYFRKISELPGVKLFSLQVDDRPRKYANNKSIIDLTEGAEGMNLILMGDLIQNFDDTANILAGLDLLISVDTATLHLAGALGVPSWLLLPFNNDWRWKAEGETTPWYDSVRIFRQEKLDDWQGVFDKLHEEVNARLLSNK